MKCNLTGGGNLPSAGGVSIRYAALFCMPCSALYHSHHIPRVMASESSRISRWVGLWCRSTRNVTLPGQSIALTWVINPRDIWWLVLKEVYNALRKLSVYRHGSFSASVGPPPEVWDSLFWKEINTFIHKGCIHLIKCDSKNNKVTKIMFF